MKKFAALLTAGTMLFGTSALANDYTYEYQNFVANIVVPQSGLCDFAKSYADHENEISASEYFSGIISAFRMDIDADGNQELVLVGDNLIRVYRISEGQPTFCASYIVDLVCDYGESYANVFIKNHNSRDYLCVESFTDSGSEKSYKLRMMYVDGSAMRLANQVSIEKTYKDDYKYESASMTGEVNTSYSKSTNNDTSTSVNPDGYTDLYDAAWQMLYKSGFSEPSFLNSVNRLVLEENDAGMYFRISDIASDVDLKTYVRASGIRTNSRPMVYFEDHSELSALNIPPVATPEPTPVPTPEITPTPEPTEPGNQVETPAPTPVIEYGITVTINGQPVDFADQPACVVDNRTLVPVRGVLEALGAKVEWFGEYQMVVASTDTSKITMRIGDTSYYVNEELRTLDVPAQLISDRTMIPARACAEALGCLVDWDQETKTVIITTPDYVPPVEATPEPEVTPEPTAEPVPEITAEPEPAVSDTTSTDDTEAAE